jgi:hypothetical protein
MNKFRYYLTSSCWDNEQQSCSSCSNEQQMNNFGVQFRYEGSSIFTPNLHGSLRIYCSTQCAICKDIEEQDDAKWTAHFWPWSLLHCWYRLLITIDIDCWSTDIDRSFNDPNFQFGKFGLLYWIVHTTYIKVGAVVLDCT